MDADDKKVTKSGSGITRRSFLAHLGVAGVAAASLTTPGRAQPAAEAKADDQSGDSMVKAPPGAVPLTFIVNKKQRSLKIDPRTTLLDCLRENLDMTGTKKGCDHGQCGACTVHVNGRRVNSCLTLAIMCQGDEITTIEGLGTPEHLHPMQQAFITCDAYQCGYCTSGQIMSATALMEEGLPPSDQGIKEAMSGNICRCGAYPNILSAIEMCKQSTKVKS